MSERNGKDVDARLMSMLVSQDELLFVGLRTVVSCVTTLTKVARLDGLADLIQQARPDLLILDMGCPIHHVALIEHVQQTGPHVKILLLASLDETEHVRRALAVGVESVVLKTQPPDVLVAAVTAAINVPVTPATVPSNGHSLPIPSLAGWCDALSLREREIVHCVTQGFSNKEIADRLCLAPITVRHHLTTIFAKLGVVGRQRLIIQAQQHGMVQPAS
jgi:DNA-binding NarL/FixJ family response regulator